MHLTPIPRSVLFSLKVSGYLSVHMLTCALECAGGGGVTAFQL